MDGPSRISVNNRGWESIPVTTTKKVKTNTLVCNNQTIGQEVGNLYSTIDKVGLNITDMLSVRLVLGDGNLNL